ncbi:hypothetical protein DKX38_017845 [Salix brachista]|uniref:Uncharacterized protein n=1 Tax=Salix brachista TaxID=2182728 RepID=A0A5N5KWC4_9ROSI|nr:hypothetical protein DKX38_017845 [Salix brachista]
MQLKQSSSRVRINVHREEAAKHASVSGHHDSPSPTSSSSSPFDEVAIDNRPRFSSTRSSTITTMSLSRLQTLTNEIELIRKENTDLRVANSELVKLTTLVFLGRRSRGKNFLFLSTTGHLSNEKESKLSFEILQLTWTRLTDMM